MIIVKICYASNIPLPKEIIKSLNSNISKNNPKDVYENFVQENEKNSQNL